MGDRIRGLYRRGAVWWFAQQVDGVRRHVSLRTRDEAEAIRKALALRSEGGGFARAGRWRAEIRAYLAERLEAQRMTRSTATARESVLRLFAEEIGTDTPETLTRERVARWHRELLEPPRPRPEEETGEVVDGVPEPRERGRARRGRRRALSPASANDYLAHVRPFLAWLVAKRRLRENPAAGVEPFRIMRPRRSAFVGLETVRRLVEEAPSEELRFVLLAGFDAGLRKTEIVEARASWFRVAEGFLEVLPSPTFQAKDREVRAVPLTTRFREFLARWGLPDGPDHDGGGAYVLRPEKAPGRSRYRYDPRRPFEDYVRAVPGLDGITMHDMRRSFASNLAIKGVSLLKIARWLGDEPGVVDRRYAHLQPSDDEIDALA